MGNLDKVDLHDGELLEGVTQRLVGDGSIDHEIDPSLPTKAEMQEWMRDIEAIIG